MSKGKHLVEYKNAGLVGRMIRERDKKCRKEKTCFIDLKPLDLLDEAWVKHPELDMVCVHRKYVPAKMFSVGDAFTAAAHLME